MTTTLTRLVSRPVVSLDSAVQHGTVRCFTVADGRIRGVELDNGLFVPSAAIRSYEADVLTFDSTQVRAAAVASEQPLGSTETPAEPHPSEVVGVRALTTTGTDLGEVGDLDLTDTGRIERIILRTGGHIPGERALVAGRYAMIISDATSDSDA